MYQSGCVRKDNNTCGICYMCKQAWVHDIQVTGPQTNNMELGNYEKHRVTALLYCITFYCPVGGPENLSV